MLELAIVRHVGVRALEAVDYLLKRRRIGEVRVDQVMHGARFRRHGQSRSYQCLLPVRDAAIAQQVDRRNLHDASLSGSMPVVSMSMQRMVIQLPLFGSDPFAPVLRSFRLPISA